MTDLADTEDEKIRQLEQTISSLDQFIKIRNGTLSSYERIIHDKLANGEISLLNLGSKKSKTVKILRENAMLQMECKILRRNLFCLVHRRNSLIESLNKLRGGPQSSTAG